MSWFDWWRRAAAVFLLCLIMGGCVPSSESQGDEKKDPNFINGKNAAERMDFPGAVDAFEKALETNPRSAAAHFELGWIFENKVSDPAAAIYHYDRYLKLSVNPDKADLVRQHINGCKLELAKSVSSFGPLPSPVQRDLEKAIADNRQLQEQLKEAQAQVAQLQSKLAQATAVPPVVAVPAAPLTHQPSAAEIIEASTPRATANRVAATEPTRIETPRTSGNTTVSNHPGSSYRNSSAKTYLVHAGDTFVSIARKNNISVTALMAANAGIKASHLRAGQTINLPAP